MTGASLRLLLIDRWRRWSPAFALDYRAVAVFRIGLGLLLLFDLVSRARDFRSHYTEEGVMPLNIAGDYSSHAALIPLHQLSEANAWQGILFVILGLFSCGICLGIYSRVCTLGAWLFLGALQARNPLVLYGADNVLMLLLLWGAFLPLGSRWSFDSWRFGRVKHGGFVSAGSVAYVLQIGAIYFFSFLSKSGETWWSGRAVETVLHLDQYTSASGVWLLQYPQLLQVLNWGTLGGEFLAPLCLLIPGPRFRIVALVLIAMLQIGFAAFMELGLFPWVSLIALIPLAAWGRSVVVPGVVGRPSGRLATGANVLCVGLIGLMLLGNVVVSRVAFQRSRLQTVLPGSLVAGMERLRLDQSWSMFSPDPPLEDGWLVIEATLEDGGKVDLLSGKRAVSEAKPPSVSNSFGGDRWKAYFLNLVQRRLSWRRVVEVSVRNWEAESGESARIKGVKVVYVREDTVLSGKALLESVELYRWEAARDRLVPSEGGD